MRDEVLSDILDRKGAVKEIAACCGVSHAAVSQWWRVPRRHVAAVSRRTGVTPEALRPDLFGRSVARESSVEANGAAA